MIALDQRHRAQRAELIDEQRRFARREEAAQVAPDGAPQHDDEPGLPERERLAREQRRHALAEEAAATGAGGVQREPIRAAARPVATAGFTLVPGREHASSPFRAARRRRRKGSAVVPQQLDESNPFAKVFLAVRRGEFVFADDSAPVAAPRDGHAPEPRDERPRPPAPGTDGEARPDPDPQGKRHRRRRRSRGARDGARAIETGAGEHPQAPAGDTAPPPPVSRAVELRRQLGRELRRLRRLKAEVLATIGEIDRLEREIAAVLTDGPAARPEPVGSLPLAGNGGEETGARDARRWLRALRRSIEPAPHDVVARLDAADAALRAAAPAAFRDLYRDALVALARRGGVDEVRVLHGRHPDGVLVLARRGAARYVAGTFGQGDSPANSPVDDRTWERARRA